MVSREVVETLVSVVCVCVCAPLRACDKCVWVFSVAGFSGYHIGEAARPDCKSECGGRSGLAYRNHRRGHGYGVMGVMDAELRQSLNDRSEGRASASLVQGVRPPRGCEDPVLRSVLKRNESVLMPVFEGRRPQKSEKQKEGRHRHRSASKPKQTHHPSIDQHPLPCGPARLVFYRLGLATLPLLLPALRVVKLSGLFALKWQVEDARLMAV